MREDECVEVTPHSVRLRKVELEQVDAREGSPPSQGVISAPTLGPQQAQMPIGPPKFEDLLEAAPDAMVGTDAAGVAVFANDAREGDPGPRSGR